MPMPAQPAPPCPHPSICPEDESRGRQLAGPPSRWVFPCFSPQMPLHPQGRDKGEGWIYRRWQRCQLQGPSGGALGPRSAVPQTPSAQGRSPTARAGEGPAVPGGRTEPAAPGSTGSWLLAPGWAALLPAPSRSGVTPGLLRRPWSDCPCKGRGLGSQIPKLDVNERAGGDALAHMLPDARGACRGQGGIFPGCRAALHNRLALAGKGSDHAPEQHLEGSSRAAARLTWGRRSQEAGGEADQALSLSQRNSALPHQGLLVPH